MVAELIESVTAHVGVMPGLRLLDGAESDALVSRVAARFGFAPSALWWWQSLPADAFSEQYASGSDGLARLAALLPIGTETALLFVTDDETQPWPCVEGTPSQLVAMLGELPFFEYFVVDPALTWILFDTHHNVLCGLGLT